MINPARLWNGQNAIAGNPVLDAMWQTMRQRLISLGWSQRVRDVTASIWAWTVAVSIQKWMIVCCVSEQLRLRVLVNGQEQSESSQRGGFGRVDSKNEICGYGACCS